MKIVLIQLLLIVVVIFVAARLLRGRGARTQAVRRLGLLVFAALAVWSILFPSVWNRFAKVVIFVAARLLRGRVARTQAVRRLGLLVFAALAVWSILFPSIWNRFAKLVGVGRGTDMVLYALVVAFLSF